MSGFNGINNFGSLTFKATDQQVTFEDLKKYDADGNGEISSSELKTAKKELGLDEVSFLNKADVDGNKGVSENEFQLWEQEQLMQTAVNKELEQIYNDPVLNKYFTNIKNELTTFLNEYIATHKADEDVSSLAAGFEVELTPKCTELKNSAVTNDPSVVKETVLDEMYQSLIQDGLKADEARALLENMEKLANTFIKSYKGNNLKADLKTYLDDYYGKSDKERAQDSVDKYNNAIKDFGGYVSTEDFKQLKTAVKELLQGILDSGVASIKLGNKNVASTSAISSAIAQYTDALSLKEAVGKAISSLSGDQKKDELIEKARLDLEQKEMQKLANIKGEEYKINTGMIDYSGIEGYFNDGQIHEQGKGWSGSKDNAYKEGVKLLNSGNLKSQLRSQIEKMLQAKGVSFDKIANIFENVYNQSVHDTLNMEDMITGRGARGLSHKGHAYINIKSCVDTFITTFNTNIEKYIDEAFASLTDLDIIDLDMTGLDKTETVDANGEVTGTTEIKGPDGEKVEGLAEAYATGKVLRKNGAGSDYYVTVAEQMIDGMRSQMLNKARSMCKANGVKFDMSAFSTMFNNAKSLAVAEAVTGKGGKAWEPSWSSVGNGAAIGATAGAAIGSFIPVVGTVIGAAVGAVAGAIGGFISGIFGTSSSRSYLDVRKLVDTFTENFKTNYTTWVNQEKNKV